MKYILVGLMALMLAGCYNGNDAKSALEKQGFTDVVIHGHSWFACSKDDTFATKFTATNPKGERVTGTACSGLLFKNTTIRW